MKILYGIQATGNGHISRARKMAAHLHVRGADVTYLISGRARELLFDTECFGNFEHRVGLTMVQEYGAVLMAPTLLHSHPLQFIREVRALDVASYDLVISDFEPVTAWAAKLSNKICIGIGHRQNRFRYTQKMALWQTPHRAGAISRCCRRVDGLGTGRRLGG